MITLRVREAYKLGASEFATLVARNVLVPGAMYIIEDLSNIVYLATSKTAYNIIAETSDIGEAAVVTDLTVAASSGSLPTPDGAVTIANAASPTVAELQEFCVELYTKLVAVTDAMKAAGLMASS